MEHLGTWVSGMNKKSLLPTLTTLILAKDFVKVRMESWLFPRHPMILLDIVLRVSNHIIKAGV